MIAEQLNKSNILINPKSKNRWELISEMLNSLVKNASLKKEDVDAVQKALFEREKSMSTGIGKGVAIPHCTTDKVDRVILALAICKNGIDFDAIDGLPVNIAVLLLVPQNKLSQHIKTLANIAKLMNNETLRERLIKTKNAETIINLIKEAEESVKR
ncbi:MAG: PTS sugar transporter subunit IIA [Spirochaetes bacterium]|nr:PTS sugar transporter subunit IIA [Spirochaetota bacterium]